MKLTYSIFKTIHILDHNSREKTKEIAKEIKTTQQNVSHIIKKLEDAKIIKNYVLLTDSSKFGLVNFCVFLRLRKFSKSFINEFISELKKYKELTCADILFGSSDMFLRFTTPNSSNFNKIFREILEKFSEDLSDYEILNQVVLYSYPSNFLSKKRYEERTIISGDREPLKLKELDKKIINLLNENSRTPYLEISKKLKTTTKTVITRVKQLESKKIINGNTILIDHKKLELNRYYLSLKLTNMNKKNERRFLKFAQQSPNVIELIKFFGKWDIMLIIVTKTPQEFREILFTIKEEFFEYLEDYSFLESEEVKLWKYLPELEL